MKLNVVRVLNSIATEEATVANLIDSEAFWNKRASDDYRDMYEYDKFMTEMVNSQTLEMLDWCEKNNIDCSNVTLDKVYTYNEWLKNEMNIHSKYLIAA